jgi:hypothetical protein
LDEQAAKVSKQNRIKGNDWKKERIKQQREDLPQVVETRKNYLVKVKKHKGAFFKQPMYHVFNYT